MKDEDDRKKKAAAVIAVIVIVLVVWFLSIHHEIDIEVDGEGTVSPDHARLGHLGSVTIEFTADDGWVLKEVLLDGSPVELTDGKLVLKWVVSNHQIKAVFVEAAGSYTLTVTSEGNGSVSPSGTVSYPAGSEVFVTAMPDDGYVIDDVKVDGQSVGSKNVTTLIIDSEHSVEVVFRAANDSSSGTTPADPWVEISVDVQIITTGADFGTVEPSGEVRVAYGGSLTIAVTLNEGYSLVSIEVDGVPYGVSPVFTVDNIIDDISVDITIAHTVSKAYTVTASASSGGTISPSGTITVAEGEDLTFTISPNSGYRLSSLLVDGKYVGSGLSTYTLKDISADRTVRAVFESTSPSPGPGPTPVKTLTRIEIDSGADVPKYCYVGNYIQETVGIIAYYSDGSAEQQTGTCTPVSWDSPGTKTVTVTYEGKTCSFDVVVPELSAIEITTEPSVKIFAKGDEISLNGIVVAARYTDSQYDRTVSTYRFSPESFDAVGEQKVTITYSEGSIEKTATLDVIIVDEDGFTTTVTEYSGKKVVDGTVVAFDRVLSTRLSAFSFDMGNTVPGIVQTITVKVRNGTGMAQDVCIYVSDLEGDDALAQQIRLSSGDSQSTVKDAASQGIFVTLGEIADGTEKTFTLTIEFVEGPDNNQAMGKSLSFVLGVFAGQKTEGS